MKDSHRRFGTAWRVAILGWLIGAGCRTPEPVPSEASAALEMGRAVLAVRDAMRDPDLDPSTRATRIAAQSTTHEIYLVIRAMLVQEIGIDEHLLRDTRPDERRVRQLQLRLEGLRQALRRIDLE